jgi:hypothetical protein
MNAVIVELVSAFERAGIDYMVVGGVAVQVWGQPRFTNDVDIAVAVDPRDPDQLVEALKPMIGKMRPDAPEFVRETGILPFTHVSGLDVDLGVSENPYLLNAIARAVEVDVNGKPVKFCTAEDLILHKLIADRDQDRKDLNAIFQRQGLDLDRIYLDPLVEQLAESTSRPYILERYHSLLSATRS